MHYKSTLILIERCTFQAYTTQLKLQKNDVDIRK